MCDTNTVINVILGRADTADRIAVILAEFDARRADLAFKKGIYIHGPPGCGKTAFVNALLARLDIDAVTYDAGDVRNKAMVESIASHNISNRNVLDMMSASPARRARRIAIVMDEVDGMNGGDKGGITALVKLIRQKKTRKQKTEHETLNPIICIGGTGGDKKIKELMKVCHTFELAAPTRPQMSALILRLVPGFAPSVDARAAAMQYIGGDLRRVAFIRQVWQTDPGLLEEPGVFTDVLRPAGSIDDAKRITRAVLQEDRALRDHAETISETDRTIVSMLYHENVADVLDAAPRRCRTALYKNILDSLCFADHIDRLTFQNQIWIFNEMSSILKTFYSNHKLHASGVCVEVADEMRFTKILTKYSTEYNNATFVHGLCRNLGLDRRDALAFFAEARARNGGMGPEALGRVVRLLEPRGVTRLDVRRAYRYLDKNVCAQAEEESDAESV
jgi:replication factor C subunit 1